MVKKNALKRSRSESVEEATLPSTSREAKVPTPSTSPNETKQSHMKSKKNKESSKNPASTLPPKGAEKKKKNKSLDASSSDTKEDVKTVEHLKEENHDAPSGDGQPTLPPLKPEEMMIPEFQTRRSTTDKAMINRQKCLVLGGRNMTSKARHLLLDLRGLMPHSREHSKLGGGAQHHTLGPDLVDICQLHQCNSFLYIDPHRQDVNFMWLGQAPSGPSVKLQLSNIHTADEIRMAGNCLKYSRPLLHFDRAFETFPHLRIVKSLLHMCFNTPRYHPKSKPFIDHIISFFWLDNHIWVRNYQIVYPSGGGGVAATAANTKTSASSSASLPLPSSSVKKDGASLLEIGPRFALEPVSIMNGCCQGKVLWRSSVARPPTEQRRDRKIRRLEKMELNTHVNAKSEDHRARYPAPMPDPLDMVFQ